MAFTGNRPGTMPSAARSEPAAFAPSIAKPAVICSIRQGTPVPEYYVTVTGTPRLRFALYPDGLVMRQQYLSDVERWGPWELTCFNARDIRRAVFWIAEKEGE